MSERINDGGPAFPVAEERWIDPMHPHKGVTNFDGMTLRDYFAAKAMQGIVSSIDSEGNYQRLLGHASRDGLKVSEWIARDAYKQADAMLAAREVKS